MKPYLLMAVIVFYAATPFAGPAETGRADSLYTMRYVMSNVEQAIRVLDGVVAAQPADYEALWRLAQYWWYRGDHAVGDERLAFFDRGREYARRATEANPAGAKGHFWYGATLGAAGQERGILNSLFMVKPMKKELDRCLSLDSTYPDCHDVLAQLLWKVPGPPLSIGDKKRAQQEAALAIRLNPAAADYWLHLGQIAIATKDYTTARAALTRVQQLPDDPEDPPLSRKDRAEAAKALEKIAGR